MMLKDLVPGDEFEYVKTTPGYREGKFLVLDTSGRYLRPVAVDMSRFIFSYNTKKVVHHYEGQEVILKERTTMKSQNSMGHFINWRFGVPIRIYEHNPGGVNYPEYEEGRLISESDEEFIIMFNNRTLGYRLKQNFHYELVPYQIEGREPAYPVCGNNYNTAYCNARTNGIMSLPVFGGTSSSSVKPIPSATLIIDGKTIELSAETTAELKKKLGV